MSSLERVVHWFNGYVQIAFLVVSLIITAVLFSSNLWVVGGIFLTAMLLFLFIGNSIRARFKKFISEREIGIVFFKLGNFDRFIGPGMHCIDVTQKEVVAKVEKFGKAEGSKKFRTKDGVFVDIEWESKYSFDFDKILEFKDKDKQINLAHALKSKTYGKVAGATQIALRKIIEGKTVYDIFQTPREEYCLDKLEQDISRRLQSLLLVADPDSILTESSGSVSIKEIRLSQKIEDAIEVACERYIYQDPKPFSLGTKRPPFSSRVSG